MTTDKIRIILGIFSVVCLIIFSWVLYSYLSLPNPSDSVTIGKPDTLIIEGKPDTIRVPQFIEKYITVKEISQYGKDSSKSDTLFKIGSDTVKLSVTTFPAVDSLHFNVSLLSTIKEITRIDTLIYTRIDTINNIKYLTESIPFYEDSWFYVALLGFGTLLLVTLGAR